MKKIGLIGLGKMGSGLAINLMNNGFDVVAYDQNQTLYDNCQIEKNKLTSSIKDLVQKLEKPRSIILIVPAGKPTEDVFDEVLANLEPEDCIIDAGNSFYKDSIRRYNTAKIVNVGFLDMGTSGGPSGALNGACLMVGGDKKFVDRLEDVFNKISIKDGYLHTGDIGSGHFSKMVHNAIEYGMMQSIAEGFSVLENSNYEFNYEQLTKLWNNGSVIRGWLIQLLHDLFKDNGGLESFSSTINSNGEGLWTVQEALNQGTPAPVLALSVIIRQQSQIQESFANKVVTALRYGFGGHITEQKEN